MSESELHKRLDFILEANITSYEYEGEDVDRGSLKNDIIDLINELKES